MLGACDAPDVYVKVTVGGQSGSTNISESFSPQWNQTVLTSVAARDLMTATAIEIWDDDLTSDDLICEGTVAFDQQELRAGEARVECGNTRNILLRFVAR